MKRLLKKLLRGLTYLAAGLLILLAVAVGIFRLMLPRLPEYQEEIKTWASSAVGMGVDFTGMNARWRLNGPELSFFGANLSNADTGTSILSADEVSIGVGLLRLIVDRELEVDRVTIRHTAIDLRQNADGNWMLQGKPLKALLAGRGEAAVAGANFELIGDDIDVVYEHPASGQLVPFTVRSIDVTSDSNELAVKARIDLDRAFGERLEISANRRLGEAAKDLWRFYVEASSLELAGWSRLQQFALPEVSNGIADFELWFDLADGQVASATTNVVVSGLQANKEEGMAPVDIQGSFEYAAEPDGWLLGANHLKISSVDSGWPQSTLQLRIMKAGDGTIDGLNASASYLDLDDLRYLEAWLPEKQRAQLEDLAPSGIMHDFDLEVSGLQTAVPDFDVSADLEKAGFAAKGSRPGVREFSGRIRADRDGGRVEIESSNLALDLGGQLTEVLVLDDTFGTVIWRRNREGIIVLSDSVQIRNADFDSQMSVQVSIPADGASPYIDFDSSWTVFDVSAMRRYLPVKLISPQLYNWLSSALVSGYVRHGTTRFNGALSDFPFNDDSGTFRIEARLEDTTLIYSPKWPAPVFDHLDIVVDGTRLYSVENQAANLGILVEDAKIEIPDLRDPVLSIDTFATGTLSDIRDYAVQSPIAEVFGGQLERVDVDGDASFDLKLTLPIANKDAYEFSTRIRPSDGTIRIHGFAAPVTGLNGTITVTRNDISSESLFGRFLGSPVDLAVSRVADADAPYRVILDGYGHTTVEALQSELSLRLEGIVAGDADYHATVRFPNNAVAQPGPLQITIKSDLFGLQSNLPAPLTKPDDEPLPMSVNIELFSTRQIAVAGSLSGDINWTARFLNEGEAWAFDRGVLALGEYPREADVRGLHIHGQVSALHLHDWLAEGRQGGREAGLGQRIRTIDLGIDHFYAVGQEFTDQHLQVNRSGQDWVIQMSGPEAQGVVTVPYDFAAGRPMTLEMERLILPGDETTDEQQQDADLDPRTLPAIVVHAGDFALGDRHLGKLEVNFERTERGLEATNLSTKDDSFAVSGTAGWIIDKYEESGQRTYIDATLSSTDVEKTATRLAYDPSIISDGMEVGMDIGWPGGPRKDFMTAMNGKVAVKVKAGQLSEVDPGAGRMFGLMSFTSLPRRLALDFSDVFDKGFGFDQITGDFRLVNGDAFTCNLTLTGPAADVGIVGRAGLAARDYDQSAVVSAKVGNTLPIAGLVLGGPPVAAALLVFSQIFKKPLKDVGQVFYSVTGSWDEPVVDSVNSQKFADVSSQAGCISQE